MPLCLRSMFRLLCAVAAIVAGQPVSAQVLLDRPELVLVTEGTVLAMARQADGSVIVGGQFESLNGVPRSNIARLQPDGTLDLSWYPRIAGTVFALSLGSDGAVYAGGSFSGVNGLALPNLVKLSGSGNGAPDPAWVPAPNSGVRALAISGFSLYVGGEFSEIGGAARARIARVMAVGGGAADSWNPSANQGVYALSYVSVGFGGDDVLIAGGAFTTIGGLPRDRIAKLSTAASTADAVWNPSANGLVTSLANDGNNVFAGGYFTTMGPLPRSRIAKMPLSGGGLPLAAFNPGANDFVQTVSLVSNVLYVGGWFTSCGGLARGGIARMSSISGVVDAAWDPGVAGSIVYAARGRSDGVAYFGGTFRTGAGASRLSLARIEINATTSIVTDVEFRGRVSALVRQADGGIIAGGDFALADGQPRGNLLRLRADGTLDPAWSAATDGDIEQLVLDSAGRIYAAGQFSTVNGIARRGVARLAAADGTPDPLWDAQSDSFVYAIAIAADGELIVGGAFTSIGGAARNRIARLSAANAVADPAWNADADNWVSALAIAGDGSVYAGGSFTSIGGQARANVARLSAVDGLADVAWSPVLDGGVDTLALADGGPLYIGGYFSTVGGQPRPAGLARIATAGNGAVDALWNPQLNGDTRAIAIDATGFPYAAGLLYEPSSTAPQRNLYKLDATTGAIVRGWSFTADGMLSAVLIADGKAMIAGTFSTVHGAARSGLAAVAIDRLFAGNFETAGP